MTSRYVKAALALLFLIFTGFLLVFKRSIPVTRLWNNYNLVYYSSDIKEEEVLSLLKNEGCGEIISLSSQTIPAVSPVTPVLPEEYSDYLYRRLGFFSDFSGDYSVLYIPSSYSEKTQSALNKLMQAFPSAKYGMDLKKGLHIFLLHLHCFS